MAKKPAPKMAQKNQRPKTPSEVFSKDDPIKAPTFFHFRINQFVGKLDLFQPKQEMFKPAESCFVDDEMNAGGGVTICCYPKGNRVYVAAAICWIGDNFSKRKGRAISLERARTYAADIKHRPEATAKWGKKYFCYGLNAASRRELRKLIVNAHIPQDALGAAISNKIKRFEQRIEEMQSHLATSKKMREAILANLRNCSVEAESHV